MSSNFARILVAAVAVCAASTAFAAKRAAQPEQSAATYAQPASGCANSAAVYDCALRPTSAETPTEALMYQRQEEMTDE